MSKFTFKHENGRLDIDHIVNGFTFSFFDNSGQRVFQFSFPEDQMSEFVFIIKELYRPIETMRSAQERISKLKELALKIKTPHGLSELENTPAYKQKSSLTDQVIISVNLPQNDLSDFVIDSILDSLIDFMGNLGLDLSSVNQPIYGSFFQNLKFALKKRGEKESIENSMKTAETALKTKLLNLPSAEVTEKLADSAAKVLKSIEMAEEAAIRIGPLLILKICNNGKNLIIIETLSNLIADKLDSQPMLMRDPQAIYLLLTGSKE
jgi:hypothetical protein